MSSSSRQTNMERVTIYWYLGESDKEVSLRQNATAEIFSFKEGRRAEIDSRSFDQGKRIFGTYVDSAGSNSIKTLATRWNPSGLKGLISLDILKARIEKIQNENSISKLENKARDLLFKCDMFFSSSEDYHRFKGHRRESITYRDMEKIVLELEEVKVDIKRKRGPIEFKKHDIEKKEKKYNEIHGNVEQERNAPAPQVTPRERPSTKGGRRNQRGK
ncbi:uncharacterized protein EAE97_007230 [Botrytis byssoidea]|uniref:Uncharacterized protein n=1 Tax=Botrytis byssoidea TaxID=139641 RepID=A0A9P5IEW4_9HELO|nr:uncharacterized protein EAE97_007230 [Botrytis byssoidea]KAF7939149.1 hypothetical protein EAE97_007230 [Botrytis byssoidea]